MQGGIKINRTRVAGGPGQAGSSPPQLEHCVPAMETCRAAQQELAQLARQARSHASKCSEVAAAGAYAMAALEELLRFPERDMVRQLYAEKQLQQLCGRVLSALQQAQAEVRHHGSGESSGGSGGLLACCFGGPPKPPTSQLKFDRLAAELASLGQQARLVLDPASAPSSPAGVGTPASAAAAVATVATPKYPQTPNSGGTPATPDVIAATLLQHAASPAPSNGGTPLAPVASPGRPLQHWGSDASSRSAALAAAGAIPGSPARSTASTPMAGRQPGAGSTLFSQRSNAAQEAAEAGITVEGPAQWRQVLHRGSRGQQVTAMLYVPPPIPGGLGRLWYYMTSPYANSMHVRDLGTQETFDVKGAKLDSPVTCFHLDPASGLLWTGHKQGFIRVWDEALGEPRCEPLQALGTGTVRCITTDETGAAWAGTDEGVVKCLRLVLRSAAPGSAQQAQQAAQQAVQQSLLRTISGCSQASSSGGQPLVFLEELIVLGELRWAGGSAMLQRPAQQQQQQHPSGGDPAAPGQHAALAQQQQAMIDSRSLREPAHNGAVASVAAAQGKVWTAGGTSVAVCLRQWTQRGELVASIDLRSVGTAATMLIAPPIVRVLDSAGNSASPAVGNSAETGDTPFGEAPPQWQLLTGHDSGIVQVWAMIGDVLRPVLRIGERMAAIKGLALCDMLGALCTAHADGRLLIQAIPPLHGPQPLTVTHKPISISSTKLACAELEASKTGTAVADGGVAGMITASNYATITLWPEEALQAAALEKGLPLEPQEALSTMALHMLLGRGAGWMAAAEPLLQEALPAVEPLLRNDTLSSVPSTYSELLPFSASSGSFPLGSSGSLPTMQQSMAGSQASLLGQSGASWDWQVEFGDLEFIRIIGEGTMGKVWLGRFQATEVAIKRLKSPLGMSCPESKASSASDDDPGAAPQTLSPKELQRLQHEVSLLMRMRHPNVICLRGVCVEPPCLVTEYCSRGSLYEILKAAKATPEQGRELDWERRLGMALDAAKGMYYLHSRKPVIVHRDLKSINLLVDRDWRVKVADFSLSRIVEAGAGMESTLALRNPRWLAPEVIQGQPFSQASDVYAFGMILWELATWEVPFKGLSQIQVAMALTKQHQRPEVPDESSPALQGGAFLRYRQYVSLLQQCWAEDAAARPTFEQVVAELRGMHQELQEAAAASMASGASQQGRGPEGLPRSSPRRLDVKTWQLDYSDLHLFKQIGEGSFGKVYQAKWHQTLVAVKILMNTGVNPDDKEAMQQLALTLSSPLLNNLQKEAELMATLRHPNIVSFLGVCALPPCVVTEFCARGSLDTLLKLATRSRQLAEQLDWERRITMMLDAAKGMLHLHEHKPPILHRDLKSPNLLVCKNWEVKLSDFNLSKILEDTPALSSIHASNPRWLAPEVMAGKPSTMYSDCYSFGVVLWEMLTWQLPFDGQNHWQVVWLVTNGGRLPFPSRQELPGKGSTEFEGLDAYIALTKRCWAEVPSERPSFNELIEGLRSLLSIARRQQKAAQRAQQQANGQQGQQGQQHGAPSAAAGGEPGAAVLDPYLQATADAAAAAAAASAAGTGGTQRTASGQTIGQLLDGLGADWLAGVGAANGEARRMPAVKPFPELHSPGFG